MKLACRCNYIYNYQISISNWLQYNALSIERHFNLTTSSMCWPSHGQLPLTVTVKTPQASLVNVVHLFSVHSFQHGFCLTTRNHIQWSGQPAQWISQQQ